MSNQVDFLPFASGAGANVLSQSDYAALAAILTGFQSGTAKSAQVNKALRQGTVMAAVLANFIASNANVNVLDNGDTDTLLTNFVAALKAANASAGFLNKSNNLSDVLSAATALANIGGAPLVSPALTGTPTGPTAPQGTSTTQLATTAFVAAREPNMARFESSGSWTCPAGVTTVYISGGGGGGGGGGGNGAAGTGASSSCGGGGGAGQCVLKTPLTVVPGNVYAITIGAGGSPGNGGATGSLGTNGGDGGSTVFGSLLTLAGGGGGQAATNLTVTGGIGGTYGGVDGGGGSTSSVIYSVGGAGGSSPFGTAPGASRVANSSSGAAGRPGQGYCSGGGGGGGIGGATSGTGSPGNAGLPGILILEW